VCLLLFGVVLARAFAPTEEEPETAQPPIGQVEERRNDVRRRTEGRLAWEPLRAGARVHAEDAVYAAADSQAVLRLDDGSRIELEESSLLVVRRQDGGPDGERPALALELVRGGARGISGGEALRVKAGEARVELARGGEVRIRRRETGASVEVAHGEAVLAPVQGERVTVRGGQRGETAGQGASVTALALRLTAPEDGALVAFDTSRPSLGFSWVAPSPEAACAFELAGTADFHPPLARHEVLGGRHEQPPLAPGIYHWRVRCADRVSEERTFVVRAHSAPLTLAPREGAMVDLSQGQPLALSWSELPDTRGYRVEVAPEGDFGKPTATLDSARPSLRLPFAYPEGRYCFRVRGGAGSEAPWSTPTCFHAVTRPILDAPRVFEPMREPLPPPKPGKGAWLLSLLLSTAHAAEAPARSALVLRWERIPGAVGYLLEVAEDRHFQKPVLRERTADIFYRWDIIARRDYYWRVRAIDNLGREGEVSEVVKIGSEVAPPVLEAPAAGARVEVAAGGALRLRWKGTAALASYRVELAADAAFTREVTVHEAREPKLSLPLPRYGPTWWRVTGIDLQGQSTESSEARAVTLVPPPPEPSGPERVVAEAARQQVQLSWTPRPTAKYQVEVVHQDTATPGGASPRVVTTEAPATLLEVKRAGHYAWRVRGVEPETAWSAQRRLEVALATPVPREPADGTGLPPTATPTLTWDAVPLAEEYEVELAAEGAAPTFQRVPSPRFEPGPLGAGAYAWRVRALSAGVQASEPSASFAFRVQPPAPMVEAPPPEPAPGGPHGVQLAALAGMTTHLAGRPTPSLSLELGWRPPRLRGRWGAALRASGYSGSQDFGGPGPLRVRSRLWAVPVEALAVHVLPVSRVDVLLGVGPLVRLVSGSAVLEDGTRLRDASVEVGGSVRAGVEYRLGPGKAYTEAGLALSSTTRGMFITAPAALAFGAGYRLEVW
jgi:hypothetical protein